MTRREIIVLAIVAVAAAGVGAGVALYFVYPNQVSIVGGETRSLLMSLNAPPGSLTTEENAAYKGAPASTTGPRRHQPPRAADWPSWRIRRSVRSVFPT